MVQPRKDQLKNVLTRHSRFDFSAVPGDAETTFAEATLNPWIVSDVAGGAQEDVPATVEGGVGPYTIIAADAITIVRQSDPVVTVVFAGADTSASRVAVAINAAMGVTIAFDRNGRLLIQSDVVGEDSVLVLADSVGGTLTKLGLAAGTYTGADAPVRGVVTRSLDALGGRGFLKTPDGKSVVTDCPSVSSVGTSVSPRWRADVLGGVPVHFRVKHNPLLGSPYSFRYFASMPLDPEVITSGGNMALLDGTDSVTLTFTPGGPLPTIGPFAVSFPTGPALTRDQVVDVINENFGKIAGASLSPNGHAEITGTVGQPFTFDTGGSDIVEVSVDGAVFVPVDLTGDVTTLDVVSAFNTALPGVVLAAAVTVGGNILLRLASLNEDGLTSSLELRNATPGFATLEKLGLSPGKYRGFWIAEPSGSSELRIRGLARGPLSSVTVLAGGATEARLGITSGTYVGLQNGEQPVAFPLLDPSSPATPQPVVSLVPEVLELGEVDPAVESIVEQFDATAAGSNLSPDRSTSGSILGVGAASLMGRSRGIADAGKPAVLNAFGLLDESYLRAVRDDSWRFFKKIVRGDFTPGVNSVAAVVTDVLETPGAEGHGGTNVGLFTVDVDRLDALSSRQFRLRFGKLSSAKVPFSVTEVGIAGAEWLVNGQDAGGDGTAFGNATAAMKLMDLNTDAAGVATSGSRFIPLTSPTAAQGDRTLRIMESEEGNNQPVSVFRQINARWTVTCGDGVNTFGDFNGATALADAVAYAVANSIFNYHVLLKDGTYTAGNLDLIPDSSTNHHVIIEGVAGGAFGAVISNTAALGLTSAALITSGTLVNKLEFKNLVFQGASTSILALYTDNEVVRFDNCAFTDQGVKIEYTSGINSSLNPGFGSNTVIIKACKWRNTAIGTIPIHVAHGGSTNSFLFEDCYIVSNDDTPAFRLSNGTFSSSFESILFNRCIISLKAAGVTGGDPDGNSGVMDVVLGGGGLLSGKSISWRDCHVRTSGTGAHLLLYYHALPSRFNLERLEIKGGEWKVTANTSTLTPFYVGADLFASAPALDIVHIEDVDWGFEPVGVQSYGAPPTELAFSGTTAEWAAFVIRTNKVVMKNVRWLRHAALSDCGDLLVHGATRWDIDGLETSVFDAGTGSLPDHRMKFVGSSLLSLGGEITHINTRAGTTLRVSTNGFLELSPGGSTNPMVVRGAVIAGLSHASQKGIYLAGDASNTQNGLQLADCVVREVGSHGFHYASGAGSGAMIKRLKFSRCLFENCGGDGILIGNNLDLFGDILIEACSFVQNGSGIVVLPGTWNPNTAGLQIMHNLFDGNFTNEAATQVSIGTANTAAFSTGCFYGNVATGLLGDLGKLSMSDGASDDFRGTETGYTYNPTSAFVPETIVRFAGVASNLRAHVSNSEMMHNRMRYA